MKLVKFNFDDLPEKYWKEYPFSIYDTFVMFGDIEKMDGHCVVCNTKTGQMYCGYHTDNFIELTEEEL